MKKGKRMLSFVLSLLMLCTLMPQKLSAAQTVYFTSANDMLLDLNDETMPFWQGSTLYVASSVFDRSKTDLGTTYSRNREKTTAIIYRSRDVLVCDLTTGTIENNSTHEVLSGSAIVRGDVVFFPIGTVAKFFGFEYSCVKIDYGYLVRVKNENVVLSDSAFIDAASMPMSQRYNQYVKTHPASSGSQQGGAGSGESGKGSAYLLIEVSDEASAEKLLSALSALGASATFLLSESEITQSPELVRRILVSGSAVALAVDAAAGKSAALASIEAANGALWRAGNTKTHLVWLQDADTETAEAITAAGYCPLTADIDYSDTLPSASRAAGSISTSAVKTGQCVVRFGENTALADAVGSLLSALRTEGCSVQRINEIAALG